MSFHYHENIVIHCERVCFNCVVAIVMYPKRDESQCQKEKRGQNPLVNRSNIIKNTSARIFAQLKIKVKMNTRNTMDFGYEQVSTHPLVPIYTTTYQYDPHMVGSGDGGMYANLAPT